jgi:hypothetical protein
VSFLCCTNSKIIRFQENGADIRRRLNAMKKMWEEDQLKPEIYVKMVHLAEGWLPVIHNYSHLIYLFGISEGKA